MRVTTVHEAGKPIYDISLEHGWKSLEIICRKLETENRRVCIVSDSNVSKYHLESLKEYIEKFCHTVETFVFPAGEEQKQLSVIMDLYEQLIVSKFDRHDLLFALGGGVVGDMTGFAAATFLRGISFVQIPTSLLAMVDSSIGGKTGVDFHSYKNMVGAFHQPCAVYMNFDVLKTLPAREFYSGFGEIIKHGLIKDAVYYTWLKEQAPQILAKTPDILQELVYRSNEVKRHVVEQDPKEQGERALLNFGHTLGHAIEKFLNFQLLHGECVSLGMVAASYISMKRGMITQEELHDMEKVLALYQLPVSYQGLDASSILEFVKNDKKMAAGKIKFILLCGIGNAVMDTSVTEEEMRSALAYLGKKEYDE